MTSVRSQVARALAFGGAALLSGVAVAQTGGPPPPAQLAQRIVELADPVPDAAPDRPLRCPSPADPRLRHFECKGAPFDVAVETLAGDWNATRTRLKDLGVTPTASYTAAWFGAASGPGTKPTYAGQLTGAVHVELDKALGAWPGLSFYASGVWASQTGADSFLNTNLLAVNALAAGSSGWLTEMYIQQTALDGQLTVAAGRLGPAVTFATLPVLANYLNTAFAASPAAPRINDPAFGAPPPNSQWGLQATYAVGRRWQVAAGIFNNNPDAAAGAKHGTDFRWRRGNTGALVVAEASYLHQQAAGDRGLAGHYTLGGFRDGNRFRDLATGATVDGTWNVYALAQQQVTRDGGAGSARGLTVWGGVNYAANDRVNPVPLAAGVGASWQGVVAGRPNDIASAGWFYGKASDTVPGASAGQAVELNYQCAITGAVVLTGDFQYLWRLNGLPSPGAAVLGLQLSLTF